MKKYSEKGALGFTRQPRRIMVQKLVRPLTFRFYNTEILFLPFGSQKLCVCVAH